MTPPAAPAPGEGALLACPFCGSAAKLELDVESDGVYVSCSRAGRCEIGPTLYEHSKADAIAAWNRRAPPPSGAGDAEADKQLGRLSDLLTVWTQAGWLTLDQADTVRAIALNIRQHARGGGCATCKGIEALFKAVGPFKLLPQPTGGVSLVTHLSHDRASSLAEVVAQAIGPTLAAALARKEA